MTDREVVLSIALLEGIHLSQIVEDFRELIGPERNLADAAIVRLTPSPYPDDAEAAEAFAASTRDELLDRRVLEADTVRIGLNGFAVDTDALTEEDALAPREIVIADTDIDAWLRTLTAIRLVVAARLGIVTDDQHDDEDDRFGIYDWLGYRLELLIQAADDLDG